MGKRFRPLALAALLSLVLAACGGAATPSQSAGASASTGTGTSASPSASTSTAASPSTAASASSSPSTSASAGSSTSTSPSASASGGAGATETASTEETTTAQAGGAGQLVVLPDVTASEFSGQTIVTAGSSTVFPVTQAVAERWQEEGGGNVTVDEIGTGAGFDRFCVAAETDISNASRAIEDEERQQCIDNGREPIEFRVGTDALAVVVNPENDFLANVTIEQLRQMYSKEVTTWNQLDPSFPNEEIQLFSPGTDSGTFDYFVEEVFDDDPAAIQAANPQFSESDNVLVQGVEGNPNAIAYFGYAYYQENEDRLKILNVEGIEPNEESTESGDYPLARPLFIYSAQSIIDEKPQVGAFINFYLQNVEDVIPEVGYFPASTDALNEARQNVLNVIGE